MEKHCIFSSTGVTCSNLCFSKINLLPRYQEKNERKLGDQLGGYLQEPWWEMRRSWCRRWSLGRMWEILWGQNEENKSFSWMAREREVLEPGAQAMGRWSMSKEQAWWVLLVWDLLSLKCLLDNQLEVSSRHQKFITGSQWRDFSLVAYSFISNITLTYNIHLDKLF